MQMLDERRGALGETQPRWPQAHATLHAINELMLVMAAAHARNGDSADHPPPGGHDSEPVGDPEHQPPRDIERRPDDAGLMPRSTRIRIRPSPSAQRSTSARPTTPAGSPGCSGPIVISCARATATPRSGPAPSADDWTICERRCHGLEGRVVAQVAGYCGRSAGARTWSANPSIDHWRIKCTRTSPGPKTRARPDGHSEAPVAAAVTSPSLVSECRSPEDTAHGTACASPHHRAPPMSATRTR